MLVDNPSLTLVYKKQSALLSLSKNFVQRKYLELNKVPAGLFHNDNALRDTGSA